MRVPTVTTIREAGLYTLSDIDTSNSSLLYLGYLASSGGWYIARFDGSAFRFTMGDSNYLTSWGNRSSLTYNTYDNVF